LTEANERNYQIPFAQVLMSEGYTVIQVSSHGQLEEGKDVVARDRKGRFHAYQMKTGNITIPVWRSIKEEVQELIELPISNPSVPKTAPYTSYLVTNGRVSEGVRRQIDARNADNRAKNRKYSFLKTIELDELTKRFIDAARQFWPSELADTQQFLNLRASDGRGLFPKQAFCEFLETWLFLQEPSPPAVKGLISASVIVVAQLAQAFESAKNWFAVFECWTCLSAAIVRLASKNGLPAQEWSLSFDMATAGITDALTSLREESVSRPDLREGSPIGDGGFVYKARATMLMGALCALELSELSTGRRKEYDPALKPWMVNGLGHLWYWGESAFPYYLSIIRYLEAVGENARARGLLEVILQRTTVWNEPDSPGGIPDPYVPVSDVIASVLNIQDDPIDLRQFTGIAYTLEAVVQMIVRRDYRDLLERAWPAISRVQLAEVVPDDPADYFSWRIEKGVHRSPLPNATQSYRELQSQSRSAVDNVLPFPEVVRGLIPFWLMVCPHRASPLMVAMTDPVRPDGPAHDS
jgi:hypothetical protein